MRADRLVPVLFTACCTLALMLQAPARGAESVVLEKRWVHSAALYEITADLNDPSILVDIGVAERGISHSESFLSMVSRRSPLAAVTGTYFDTRTLLPVGSIVAGGKVIHDASIGTAVRFLRFEGFRQASVASTGSVPIRSSYAVEFRDLKKGESCGWSGVDTGIRTGPRLLADGYYALNPRREGFRHPGLFGARARIAMGITRQNKLLLIAVKTPVTFAKLAGIMKALGAADAVCLDGGTSSAMYYRGRLLCRPGRALTNILEIRRAPAASGPGKLMVARTFISWQNAPRARVKASSMLVDIRRRPADDDLFARQPVNPELNVRLDCEQCAILAEPVVLRRAECRSPFAPVHGAKLPGLKRPKNSEHLVHVAADAQVMHHLVA